MQEGTLDLKGEKRRTTCGTTDLHGNQMQKKEGQGTRTMSAEEGV